METVLLGVISCAALCLGAMIYKDPLRAIDWQRKFYAMINWRMEPISLEKEIRNTRWMGLFLIVFTLGVLIYRVVR